ncbi:T9SS type B sorting domain-containing protein [Flavobacterium sp. K5-23]|uniref:T9SS type B sorting domain-containing protein n=1 Tax=Flavobacterium sp. K5-23 TaxID=2746225 RepID=UPI00200C04BE|nr:T9SS type B sorting domain-containing protein [Flavobacterium sp. K5-23]UQD57434.1 T9SS type B sorting domain-containing protein [Flavobacterium sp. K5-23]
MVYIIFSFGIINGTVTRSIPYRLDIGYGTNTNLIVNEANISYPLNDKGFIIEAEEQVYASIRLRAGGGNQAGGLISKGIAGLGTQFRIGSLINTDFTTNTTFLTFISVLATENNTTINFSDIKNGVALLNNPGGNNPLPIILNRGESYTLAAKSTTLTSPNRNGLIGSLVSSDKPIAVNCGSFVGSNGTSGGVDLGFDQIVSAERTGKEYIFVKGPSTINVIEKPLLIAHENDTKIFLNDNTNTPDYILNAGQYLALDGSNYSPSGNLYVKSNKNIFAYQGIGGNTQANQEMYFVPPLSCETPNIIDNIPFIDNVGDFQFTTNNGVNIVTETGADLSFILNGINYTYATLPSSVTAQGPFDVIGNTAYKTYKITGLSGNISVFSTKQLYLSYFGSNVNATHGGYYSGFTFKPDVSLTKLDISSSNCIPNIILGSSSISSFDKYKWFFNDFELTGPESELPSYRPTQPGYYHLSATISACGTTLISDRIPVSNCPTNMDNDLANDNIDIDNDNDGITNCTESYGNQNINISNLNSGSISVNSYSNSFNGILSNSAVYSPTPFIGQTDGSFITEIPAGKLNSVSYLMSFNKPISIGMEYITTANTTDLLNADAEYIINSDIDKTITVLNPSDQLLIDTNYDGIYESGITEYSSFEIRFRLKSVVPLAAGTGNFKFQTYLTNSIRITHKNLSDTAPNKSSFKFYAVCLPKDTDGDGIADQLDLDSDNDGIPDTIEAQGTNVIAYTSVDLNKDGMSDAFGTGFIPKDTDNDVSIGGVPDYLDLDSDNDGIYDLVESGSNSIDTNNDGIIDGPKSSFGTNGLSLSLETANDSGTLNYTIRDTDGDGIKDYREIDSDNDLCNDVIEAGFQDPNNDGLLGNNPLTVNTKGIVTSGTAYSSPHINYITSAPIVITTQPKSLPTCELENAKISVEDNGGNTYQWQVSTNGSTWVNINNNVLYSGALSNTLIITRIPNAMNGYKYRVILNKIGNSCGLISNEEVITILPLPTIVSPITLVQCDDDADGYSNFNLTEKNSFISTNYSNETFTYFTTQLGANTNSTITKIANPLTYNSTNGSVWARVENSNGCFSVAQLNLVVSTTQIPTTYKRTFSDCDDYIDVQNDDKDGISTFNFSSVTSEIKTLYLGSSSSYTIHYYRNETDALAEANEITNTSNYRNIGYPNQQQIWVRIESTLDNACYGLGPHITLTVNAKPNINTNDDHNDDNLVCSNLPSFYVQLDAGINDGSPTSNYSYIWTKDSQVLIGQTQPTLDVNAMGLYTVEVKTFFGCSRIRTIKVTSSDIAHISTIKIEDLNENNSVTINATGQGEYEYSIDSPYGPFQKSNFFENVSAGIHEVYIIDKKGCGTISKSIAVIGVPKFFTPNGDGYNDYWNLKGVNANFNSKSIIYIFDRYGKLLNQIIPSDTGWDGTFNSQPLSSDDYWYTVKLEDGREAKGHFTLKR